MHTVSQTKLVARGFFGIYFLLALPFVIIPMTYKYKIVGILFSLLFIMYIIYAIYKENKRFVDVYRWIGRQARIKQIKIVKYACMSMFRKWNTKNNTYKIDIEYEYQVNDKAFTSSRYAFSYKGDGDCNFLYTLDEATKIVQQMKKDKTITVYVNPKNPEESVVVKGKSDYYGIPYFILGIYVISLVYFSYRIYVLS